MQPCPPRRSTNTHATSIQAPITNTPSKRTQHSTPTPSPPTRTPNTPKTPRRLKLEASRPNTQNASQDAMKIRAPPRDLRIPYPIRPCLPSSMIAERTPSGSIHDPRLDNPATSTRPHSTRSTASSGGGEPPASAEQRRKLAEAKKKLRPHVGPPLRNAFLTSPTDLSIEIRDPRPAENRHRIDFPDRDRGWLHCGF